MSTRPKTPCWSCLCFGVVMHLWLLLLARVFLEFGCFFFSLFFPGDEGGEDCFVYVHTSLCRLLNNGVVVVEQLKMWKYQFSFLLYICKRLFIRNQSFTCHIFRFHYLRFSFCRSNALLSVVGHESFLFDFLTWFSVTHFEVLSP